MDEREALLLIRRNNGANFRQGWAWIERFYVAIRELCAALLVIFNIPSQLILAMEGNVFIV